MLPVFDELHPEARQGLYKSLEHLASENELYRALLKEKLNQIVERDGSVQRLPYSAFLDCFVPRNDAKRLLEVEVPEPVEGPTYFQLLFEWLRQFGFNTDQCKFIFEALGNGVGNKYYSPTHQLVIGRNELQLSEIKSVSDEVIQIEERQEEILSPIHLRFSRFLKNADFIIDKSPNVAQLDVDKIQFPLTLRHWHHGDRFHPLGMKGSKLLSDFFVDQKFTEWQKQNVWLLVSADGDILWVIGHRIDDRYKVTNSTKTIFLCRQIPMEK